MEKSEKKTIDEEEEKNPYFDFLTGNGSEDVIGNFKY